MNPQLGYCTNVHAGADLAETQANLRRYALSVKARFCPDETMGIGLWLSAGAARQLKSAGTLEGFRDWLRDSGLTPFTLNGFPYGDFHQKIVKHKVYEPNWFAQDRFEYTRDLIQILHQLLPPGMEGSISTLPVAWGDPPPGPDRLSEAADRLRQVADILEKLERDSGRLIYVCIEPEPGCYLQRTGDVVNFFQDYLLHGGDESSLRRYLRVCHDVCHAAVMFEDQTEVIEQYRAAGILVGKVQVSSAVVAPLDAIPASDRVHAAEQLAGFAEDRYLHQTVVTEGDDLDPVFYEDLPLALDKRTRAGELNGEWRIHFHVPIYLERFGFLKTTRADICDCLRAARAISELVHFEVETYAWGVLPVSLQQPDLAAGIADELSWLSDVFPRG